MIGPLPVSQRLSLTALLVRDYDEAIAFYVGKLGFELREDTQLTAEKRWVVVGPPRDHRGLLLARAVEIASVRQSVTRAAAESFCF